MSLQVRSRRALRRTARTVALAATGLVLVCCGTNPASSSASPAPSSTPSPAVTPTVTATPSPAALQWTGTVCRALAPVVGTLTSPPSTDVNNLSATRQSYLSYLATAAGQVDTARQQISAAGTPPVSGGDQIGSTVDDQVSRLHTDIDQARSRIRQTDPNDAASVIPVLKAAGNVGSSSANSAQLLSSLRRNPQLAQAINQEPACASLRSVS